MVNSGLHKSEVHSEYGSADYLKKKKAYVRSLFNRAMGTLGPETRDSGQAV